MAQRLADSTSPYLRQHADNPVDWWEWGPPALDQARRTNQPIFLSVGYAACHWCHVMAHESFEDDGIAELLNNGYVAIKVDREERPDIDAVYLDATVAMTGHGGWPMTCLLTPEGEPFWCGTYLPTGQLRQLLTAVSDAWATQEQQLRAHGASVVEALSTALGRSETSQAVDVELLARAIGTLSRSFDAVHGGFGSAPKFPPSMVLEFLLRHHARTGSTSAWQMAEQTATAMARGGLYDQLAGGFARYAVDQAWVVPHFEKMLYDNAQLVRVYAHLWAVAEAKGTADTSQLAQRVVRETVGFLLDSMRTREGAFASSLDADTDGVEGATYVWTPAQLTQVLGPEDGSSAAQLLAVTAEGTFEHGTSTLQLRQDPADRTWWQRTRERLRRARDQRQQPDLDDKVVTAWNGLAIAALAEAGWLLQEPAWVQAATEAAEFLLTHHLVDRRLRRSSREGQVGAADAVAEDYGDLAEGLVMLHTVTADPSWLTAAGDLLVDAHARFGAAHGRFHDTAQDAEQLVLRPRARGDNAEPCGQSALAGAFLVHGAAAGSAEHLGIARAALEPMGHVADRDPRFAGWALAVGEAAVAGPLQVAISTGSGQHRLAQVARQAPPGSLVVLGRPGLEPPLLQGRADVAGQAAAYVCRGTVCDLPRTAVEDLAEALAGPDRRPSDHDGS